VLGLGRAGDTNGDGFEDLLLGLESGTLQGLAYGFAGISTIPTGIVAFGAGCPQSIGTTGRIGANRPASSSQPFSITLSRVPPGTLADLIIGVSNTHYLTALLP